MPTPGFKKLIDHFATVTTLPIEVETIRAKIIELGFQDEIVIGGKAMDRGQIRAAILQYSYKQRVYGDPIWRSVIGFNLNDPPEWQRVACVKELVHIFDHDFERTGTPDDLEGLIEKLLGPMTSDEIGLADLMAATDKFAQYQCMPLLFPEAARAVALRKLEAGETTLEKIATRVAIPRLYSDLVMSSEWPKIREMLVDC